MPHFFASTSQHRPIQRSNGILEIMNGASSSIDPRAAIPFKVMQILLSGRSVFNPELQPYERGVQGLQLVLCTAYLGLLITLLFESTVCENPIVPTQVNRTQNENSTGDNSSLNFGLCFASLIVDLFYKGVLLATWAPGEVAKIKKDDGNAVNLGA